jgi:hypothetical protein
MAISTLSVRMLAEPQRVLNFSAISPAYMGIGTPLDHPARLLWVLNLTDALLQFSIDGIDDHFPLPAQSNFVFDITTNTPQTLGCYLGVGTRFYVKEIGVPSSGNVYIVSFYGSTN